MEDLKIYKKIDIKNPLMIAGWPGMGSVALGVVDYLRNALGAVKFAEIKTDPLATLDSVLVDNGHAKLPPAPKNVFYYLKDPAIILFEGEAQVHGPAGIGLLRRVLDVAAEYKVGRVYTGAAFPLPVSHKDSPDVYGAVNDKSLLGILMKFGVTPMEGGQISGLNGLMLGFAREKGMEAVCLLATMPQYAINLPNPKASGAIIETLRRMIGFDIDLHDLDNYIKDIDEKMAVIEEKVKDVLTVERDTPESRSSEKKTPPYIVEKIEKLFQEAVKDRSKALALKKELDRWDLYMSYEDRFLNLFKNE